MRVRAHATCEVFNGGSRTEVGEVGRDDVRRKSQGETEPPWAWLDAARHPGSLRRAEPPPIAATAAA